MRLVFATLFLIFFLPKISAQEKEEPAEIERQEEKLETAEDEFVPLSEMRPLEKSSDHKHKHSFQYGLSAANTIINDSGGLPQGYFLGSYRPFFKYLLNEQHIFNVRGKFAYKNNPSITEAQMKVGAVRSTGEYNLELFNTELNFNRHQITAGRSFYKLGRGLLFANFADGAEYNGAFKYALVKVHGLYSGQYGGCTISLGGCATNGDIAQKGLYEIVPGRAADVNIPDPGRRFFAAAEVMSPQLYGSSLYLMAQYSRDMSRDAATTGTNKGRIFAYDPLNLGAGMSGYIVTPRLRYLTEFVLQRGKTYNKNTTNDDTKNIQTDVNAWGITADLNYSLPWFEHTFKPGLIAQYAAGSGRDSSPTSQTNVSNPSQENVAGDDNNFYFFGAYSAGLALKPKLSNLHVMRAGFQFRPLNHFYWGRSLMIAFKYTYYRKINADYSISDSAAKLAKPVVGQGLDLQAVWDLRSDVKLFYAYGVFLPSEAYDAANAKTIQIHILSLNFFF